MGLMFYTVRDTKHLLCVFVFLFVGIYVFMYVYVCMYVNVCLCICICVYVYACMFVCVCVCVCVRWGVSGCALRGACVMRNCKCKLVFCNLGFSLPAGMTGEDIPRQPIKDKRKH